MDEKFQGVEIFSGIVEIFFGGVYIFSGRDEIFSGGVEIISAVLEIFLSGVVEILLRGIEKTQGVGGLTNIQRG